ncbi:unnamed protein product [Lactuca saligna]|uniref:Uncharacterized protein n=1 Tax=Lactuca saligna TaxID=75948 RepID=A0AA36EAW3_LACSI|nr:unnamed protein product [Lactuca saligna]
MCQKEALIRVIWLLLTLLQVFLGMLKPTMPTWQLRNSEIKLFSALLQDHNSNTSHYRVQLSNLSTFMLGFLRQPTSFIPQPLGPASFPATSMSSPKKNKNDEVTVSKVEEKQTEPETVKPLKEVVPSKTDVFKKIKKMEHMSRSSSDRSPSFSPSMIRKPHVTRKGVVLREVPVPVSPSAKKRKAKDMAKHISKN